MPAAASRLYWWAPCHWLMKNRDVSLSTIGRYTGPVLASHGKSDTLVPYDLGRALFDAAPGTKTFVDLDGGHNDEESPDYYVAFERFLAELPPARAARAIGSSGE
jgi:fermentation-respiration switch protein FrsA (DUF1100 family)